MNEINESFLRRFYEEDAMVEAVKEAVKEEAKKMLSVLNPSDDNAVIGQQYRAYIEALDIITKAFNSLAKYKEVKQDRGDLNKAR